MSPVTIGITGLLVLIVLLLLEVHVGVALGLVGILGLSVLAGFGNVLGIVGNAASYYATSYDLIVIPLFVIMGSLAAQQGLAGAAYDGLARLLGRLPGGLGVATVGAATLFGTCTGSSIVCAVVFARTSAPLMRKRGYDKKFAYGIVSSAGIIGMLIPPSVLAVVYATLTQESIGKLLMAGVVPGILVALVFSLLIVGMVKLNPNLAPPAERSYSLKEKLIGIKDTWPIGIIALVVIGGIYTGVMTPTEAGAVGALAIIILGTLLKALSRRAILQSLTETVGTTAMIFVILIGARLFSRFLILSGLAEYINNFVLNFAPTPMLMLGVLIVVYLIMGCFFDSVSMLSVTIPVIYPTVKSLGLDPIWFAMIVILSIETGLITPPVGLNIFGVKGVAEPDVSLGDLFRGAAPFLVGLVVVLILVMAFPPISTYIPSLMK